MSRDQQTVSWMIRAISLALILLFGPVPVISLLAQPKTPQCQLACCKRIGSGQSCALHHSPAAESSALGFHTTGTCPPACSYAVGEPSSFAVGFRGSAASFVVPSVKTNQVSAAQHFGVCKIIDSFQYQRPPPALA